MNITTKTANESEAILDTMRANDSLSVRHFYDIVSGRFCKRCGAGDWQEDANGRQFIKTNVFTVDGLIQWEVWKLKIFWRLVADGKIGINPRVLFRPLAAPPQTAQTQTTSTA